MNDNSNSELSPDGKVSLLCTKDCSASAESDPSVCGGAAHHKDKPLTNTCPILLYPLSINRLVSASSAATKTTLRIAPAPVPTIMHGTGGNGSEASPRFVLQPPALAAETVSAPEFTHQAIVHLIEAVGHRLDMYGSRERARLFHSVQQELEAQGHCLPVERIRRKWNNLIVTYKRVKDRSRETGQAKTSWEYYEMMDAMLGKTIGAQSSGPASAMLVDMATTAKGTAATELPSSSNLAAAVAAAKPSLFPGGLISACAQVPSLVQSALPPPVACDATPSPPGSADASHPRPAAAPGHLRVRPKLRGVASPSSTAASFLVQQHGQVEKRTALLQSFLTTQEERSRLEEERLRRAEARERRREKREGRMAEALGRIATALELVSSKQDTIIALLQRLADKQ